MSRALALILLLAPAAWAQGVDELIGTALDPRTGPAERTNVLERLGKITDGLDRLAERGLDKKLEPEVIHAVVDVLLRAENNKAYLEPIIRLLDSEPHRAKVLRRIQVIGEHPERARVLMEECQRLAGSGQELGVRRAAILALAEIPQRRALEIIVEVGRAEPKLADTARPHLELWLGVETIDEAADYLAKHPRDSFWDLARERVRGLSEELASRGEMAKVFIANAPLPEVLRLLRGTATRETRAAATARLRELAAKNGVKQPAKMAGQVVLVFRAEKARGAAADGATLANLLETMRALTKGGQDAALWKAIEPRALVAEIEPLVGSNAPGLGSAAVRLLGLADQEGTALVAFARDHADAEVRKEAIQYLGNLAGRMKDRRPYVGLKLAELLQRGEKEIAVRTQILSTLTQPYLPVEGVALAAIRVYLAKKVDPPLTDAEISDCITILGQSPSDDALAVLFEVSRNHPKPTVRRFAVEEGLLARAQRATDAQKQQAIFDHLKGLALSAGQPEEARRAVIDGLGRRGTRLAHATLEAVRAVADLPATLQKAVDEAELVLAERLAAAPAGGTPDRDDFIAAVAILEKGWQRDPERMAKLAELIVRTGDDAKLPVRGARYLRALLYSRSGKPDAKVTAGLYEQAVQKAKADGIGAPLHVQLLTEYKAMLAGRSDPDALKKLLDCTRDLAELAQAQDDKKEAATLFLDAAGCALKIKDVTILEEMLNKAMGSGGVSAGELAERHRNLLAELEKLKAPGG